MKGSGLRRRPSTTIALAGIKDPVGPVWFCVIILAVEALLLPPARCRGTKTSGESRRKARAACETGGSERGGAGWMRGRTYAS